MPTAATDPSQALLAAQAIDSLGAADFYDCLLALLAATVANDLAAMVRYSRASPPDLILPRVEPTAPMMAYYQHFHAFDPFDRHWKGGGDIGVFRLREMDARIGNSLYAREFLTAMSIHDEIAVFLPPIGSASPTLILDRAKGVFTRAEVARVRAIFPMLAALHRRHIGAFIAAGTVTERSPIGQLRPLRLIDHNGVSVFETQSWADYAARPEAAIAEALALLAARGPCVIALPDHLQLRRTKVPNDFGPAPGGYCDEITGDGAGQRLDSRSDLPRDMASQLTEREQQVALKMLQGYPVIEIARRLGLSRGTIKNYRLAIYRKLDITTERELFGTYIALMRAG
jgi:DNA-binding CsgD family transcriptional regulator